VEEAFYGFYEDTKAEPPDLDNPVHRREYMAERMRDGEREVEWQKEDEAAGLVDAEEEPA
jgi:hypothetical protein